MNRHAAVATLAIVLAATVGCTGSGGIASPPSPTGVAGTPTGVSPTASATTAPVPTPTATWSASQQAAVDALGRFRSTEDALAMAPSEYSRAQMLKKLAQVSGGAVPTTLVGELLYMKKKGYRRAAATGTAWVKASRAVDTRGERGLQVYVTVCQDQRAARVVDQAGVEVPEYQKVVPPYLLRQYSVRKPAGASVWRVYGAEVLKGACP